MNRALAREGAIRSLLWLSLGSWVGAWGFFAFVVSRVAFRIVPGDVVGELVGVLIRALHLGGAVAGLIAAGALAALGRRGFVVWLPVGLALAAAASELILSPEIAALRPSALGAASTEQTQARFGLLHGLSLGLFMGIHLATLGLLGWVAWLDARDRQDPHPRNP